jgi:16S rRNA (uracil1498-N3)-methyltransferase
VSPQRLLIAPNQQQQQQIALTAAQQRYLGRVLRLGPGDQFVALDGQGHQWLAALTGDPAVATVLEAMASAPRATAQVTLLAALPKGNGFDEVVRQATELGVNRIQPVISDRTLIRPSEQKRSRWQRIAAEATEQSERLTAPDIAAPLLWTDAVAIAGGTGYLCWARGRSPHLLTQLQQDWPSEVAVAVGPEGGWTTAEIELALAANFQPVSLGPTVLRAVTAPIVALSLIQAVFTLGAPSQSL